MSSVYCHTVPVISPHLSMMLMEEVCQCMLQRITTSCLYYIHTTNLPISTLYKEERLAGISVGMSQWLWLLYFMQLTNRWQCTHMYSSKRKLMHSSICRMFSEDAAWFLNSKFYGCHLLLICPLKQLLFQGSLCNKYPGFF